MVTGLGGKRARSDGGIVMSRYSSMTWKVDLLLNLNYS